MSADSLFRSFTPDIEVRSGGDGRTVHGIAVPYAHPQRIDSTLTEQFARGAFRKQLESAHRVPFARDHMSHGGQLIGKITQLRDDAAGLYFEARVSPTSLGNDTLELLRDGALDQVSIGFRPGQDRRLPGGVVERVTAHLTELAVVLQGAYGEHAMAMGIRAAGCTCGSEDRMAEARRILQSLPEVLPLP